jgi:hypothetical protein
MTLHPWCGIMGGIASHTFILLELGCWNNLLDVIVKLVKPLRGRDGGYSSGGCLGISYGATTSLAAADYTYSPMGSRLL